MYSYGPPHMAEQKQDDQLEHTYSSYVRIRDVALKTCQMRWTIGRSDERGSGISIRAAHDNADDYVKVIGLSKAFKAVNRGKKGFSASLHGLQSLLNALGFVCV